MQRPRAIEGARHGAPCNIARCAELGNPSNLPSMYAKQSCTVKSQSAQVWELNSHDLTTLTAVLDEIH